MSRKDADLSPGTILPQTRTQNNCQSHGAKTANRVDDSRSRKVNVAVAQIQCGADLRQPASAPSPAAGDWVQDRADKKLTNQECPEGDPLAHRADNNVTGGFHKHDFK